MAKQSIVVLILALLLAACGDAPSFGAKVPETFGEEEALSQEVSFSADDFKVVGDLRLPAEGDKHPAVILVHGSGSATRDGRIPYRPLIEIFLRNGFAVYSWDKPGSGASTGEFSGERELRQRAAILTQGIQVLSAHPDIDSSRIGLWGISQAGWVMPLALEQSDSVAFMIVVSGGAEDSIEQMAYQVGQQVVCNGGSEEQAAAVERYWSQFAKAGTYDEYREAVEILLEIPGVEQFTGLDMAKEGNWKAWPRNSDAFFDPMEIVEHSNVPMLVFYGELDKNIDPVQGAEAYEQALLRAGNQAYQIEVIPSVGHVLMPATTGCIGESGGGGYAPEFLVTLEEWLRQLPDS